MEDCAVEKAINFTDSVDIEDIVIAGERFFKIRNNDKMRPFFMSIVSGDNHWMFISSNGGLTAGRRNAEYALFPYYTDDKITESTEVTGSKTILHVSSKEETFLWEPLSIRQEGIYSISRNLYKNEYGNKVIFEEINHDLKLCFRYQWSSSNKFGFVRSSSLINQSKGELKIKILDGIQNILPAKVEPDLQNAASNLVDAYKRNELVVSAGLGIYALSATIVDRAEPSEALKANVVWSLGMSDPKHLVSSLQLNEFRKGGEIDLEYDVKAEKGAYFLVDNFSLYPDETKGWLIVADVNKNHSDIVSIIKSINEKDDLYDQVIRDVEVGTEKLIKRVATSDGLQCTNDSKKDSRHFSNTLFNIMRGGVFPFHYDILRKDFVEYLEKANSEVYKNSKNILDSLSDKFSLQELKSLVQQSTDKDLKRLALEYLPLTFSRRHGDPSRPWNKFDINTQNENDGSIKFYYEGNWRDIFQNWESLGLSYPAYVESMMHKFFNATTFEGYNPYRVTKDGFDWEVVEPDNPWSYIGYWGDHQIIYLLKFLEFLNEYDSSILESYYDQELFVFANVPYKIKSYQDIFKNPKETIDFDFELDQKIRNHRSKIGADGALLYDANDNLHRANLIEKMMVTLLCKLSNLIPDAGIWLNTQRPEWNDANNALVGNGVSMVTVYYLRRFISFFDKIISNHGTQLVKISSELLLMFDKLEDIFQNYAEASYESGMSNEERKSFMDKAGEAAFVYRDGVYKNSFSGNKGSLELSRLSQFLTDANKCIEKTIKSNKREDGLYHAYNLIQSDKSGGVVVGFLDEMLEGQVALLSSGFLNGKEVLDVLSNMKSSKLFREDQYSYILYPNKNLPKFLEKNNISSLEVQTSKLLSQLILDKNFEIVEKDHNGDVHFNGNFRNAIDLESALIGLKDSTYAELVEREMKSILQLFEKVFQHKKFTGRSGTFYGYEGLGSIYWHMVSKLLLSVQECLLDAIASGEDKMVIGGLLDHFYEINAGIGVHKPPTLYGAFPTDPYSHTPGGKGAQQPGMTGQVKEDILSRFGELGVSLKNGSLVFNPCLLRKEEFLKEAKKFEYWKINGEKELISLSEESLAFTVCQVPVVYQIGDRNSISIITDDNTVQLEGLILDHASSQSIFNREDKIKYLKLSILSSILK